MEGNLKSLSFDIGNPIVSYPYGNLKKLYVSQEIRFLIRNLKFLSFYIGNPMEFFMHGIFSEFCVLVNKLLLWQVGLKFYHLTQEILLCSIRMVISRNSMFHQKFPF